MAFVAHKWATISITFSKMSLKKPASHSILAKTRKKCSLYAGTTFAVMNFTVALTKKFQEIQMTATAQTITNLFPGSPQMAGETLTAKTGQSQDSGFAGLLEKAEAAPEIMPFESPDENSSTNPFEDLFKFIELLWGSGDTDKIAMVQGRNETVQTGSFQDAQDKSDASEGKWTNGFFSEIQLILAMIESLTKAFSTSEQEGDAIDLSEKEIPSESKNLVGVGDTQTFKTTPSSISASAQMVAAPGIQISATDAYLKDSFAINNKEIHEQRTSSDKNALKMAFPGFDEKSAKGWSSINKEDFSANQAAQERPEDLSGIDLHLMRFSYSKEKGLDITDIQYSKPMSGSQTTAEDSFQYADDPVTEGMLLSSNGIKMAKATVADPEKGNITYKKIHVAPSFSIENTESPLSSNVAKDGTPIEALSQHDTVTINFNEGEHLEADPHKGNPTTTNNEIQDGSHQKFVIGATDTVEPTKNSATPQAPQPNLNETVTAQVKEGLTQALQMNKNKAILHLNPPELGTVKVSISVSHNNHVQASFVADHPETRHILEAHIQNLKDSLAQNGFSMTQVNVDVSGGFSQWAGSQQETLTPFGFPSMWLNNRKIDSTPSEAGATRTSRISPNGVHIIA